MRFILAGTLAALSLGMSSLAASPNDVARFLAGLPVRETPLASLAASEAWVTHAVELDAAWDQLEKRQLAPVRDWRAQFLTPAQGSPRPLLYFFSGPDILYAHAFFPDAPTYVMCGVEPLGSLPSLESLTEDELANGLRQLRTSLESVLRWSFFITKSMRKDLEASQLRGTLPILCLFLARSGCHLESVDQVAFEKDGRLREGAPPFNGTRIRFTKSPGSEPQTLFYFSTDLSSGPLGRSGFLNWCSHLGNSDCFVKSASYLMHTEDFASVRNFLIQQSTRILQDDSGIPLRHFTPDIWRVRTFGSYPGPIELFKQFTQPALSELYRQSHPAPLQFGFGYRWQAPQSTLLLAEKLSNLRDASQR